MHGCRACDASLARSQVMRLSCARHFTEPVDTDAAEGYLEVR